VLLLAFTALADLPDTARLVATDRLAAGVQADGSLVNDVAGLGLRWDADGPEGVEPMGGDWLYEGWAMEVWSVAWADTLLVNGGPWTSSALTLTWDSGGAGGLSWLHGAATSPEVDVEEWIEAPWGEDLLWITLRLTAHEDLGGVTLGRMFDPDPDAWLTGSYDALLTAEPGAVAAESLAEGRALALATSGGVGAICQWCTDPADVLAASAGTATGDDQLGLAVGLGDLAAGDSVDVVFVYAFGAGTAAAVDLASLALTDEDHDRDGVAAADDCAPLDGHVAAGLEDVADGLDNDCDGVVDEDAPAEDTATTGGWSADVPAGTPGEGEVPESKGCATQRAPLWLGLLALLGVLRRSR
jgi:hypothetical protein